MIWHEIGSGGSSVAPVLALISNDVVSPSLSGYYGKIDAKTFKNIGNESITIKAYVERGLAYIRVIASYRTGSYTLESINLTNEETEYTISLINPSGELYEKFTIETGHMEPSTVSHMRIINNESV
jgi:hypothetical protein